MKRTIRRTETVLFLVGVIYCVLIVAGYIGISLIFSIDLLNLKMLAGGFFVGFFTLLVGIRLLDSRGKRRGRRR